MTIQSLPLAGFVLLAFLALPLARLRRGLLALLGGASPPPRWPAARIPPRETP